MRWHKLASPPTMIVEVTTSWDGALYAKASAGETYHYFEGGQRWVRGEIPETPRLSGLEIIKPCDFSSLEFSMFTNSPRDIVDCVQYISVHADSSQRRTYVLDKNDNIWAWFHSVGAHSYVCLIPIFLIILGAIGGLIVAIATSRDSPSK